MSSNRTGKNLTKAKTSSLNYHLRNNKGLYEEYKNSQYQFTMSFSNFKKMKRKRKK